ncbi:MAG: DUF2461 domain-containing protein [Pseudomonadota bacterium]
MSKDGFTEMVETAQAFFTELEQNNTKAFFEPRKEMYTESIKKPAEFFAEIMAEEFSRLSGQSYRSKVFRIYRDVRFSKDKTPYKPYLHMLWSTGPEVFSPKVFFGCERDRLRMGLGIFGMVSDELARLRAFIDSDGDRVLDALNAAQATWSDWGPDPLKRVPKPYAPDHPHGDLLKRKAFAVHLPFAETWRDDGLVKAVRASFEASEPLRSILSEV